jgi:hypothetical protein
MCVVPGERRARDAAVLAIVAAATAHTARAGAAPQAFAVALEYHAPPSGECPGAEDFRASVARQLGFDAFRPRADRRVAVEISRNESGFASWIKWSDARGQWVGDRRLSSRSSECGEIAANTAFAVAVQIQLLAALAPANPEEGAQKSSPPTSTTNGGAPGAGATSNAGATDANATAPPASSVAPPSKPPATSADTKPEATPPPARRPAASGARFRLSAGLGPSISLGLAPHPTGTGRIFVSGRLERVSLELAVDAALPAKRAEADGSGFTLYRFAAGLAGCGHLDPFAGCLTATFGRVEAHGFGLDEPASPAGWFTQLGARIAARHDFGDRFFAGVRADGLLMLSTWSVTLDGRTVWTTPRVGALIGADLGVNFF